MAYDPCDRFMIQRLDSGRVGIGPDSAATLAEAVQIADGPMAGPGRQQIDDGQTGEFWWRVDGGRWTPPLPLD